MVVYFDNIYTTKAKRKISPKEKTHKFLAKLDLELPGNIEEFIDKTPCSPVPFGYKAVWLALRTIESKAVLKLLNDKNNPVFPTNWQKGVEGGYEGYCFISPPVEGWTLVLNPNLGNLSDKDTRNFLSLLSKEFGEAHFFGSHRIVSYSAWARYINGETIRAFSIADGLIDMDAGELTPLEDRYIEDQKKSMKVEELEHYEVEGFNQILYYDDLVMEMAGHWSINPQNLENYKANSLGLIFEDF